MAFAEATSNGATPAPGPSRADDTGWLPGRNLVELRGPVLLRNHVYGFTTDDPRGQAFAMLRSRVLRYVGQTKARLIAVTSANPGEGKSFVALNLSAALSRIHPTWLVDADLRHPSIANRLGFKPNYGVDTFLISGGPIVPVRCAMTSDVLTLVTINEACSDSAKLLASPRASELFAKLRDLAEGAVCLVDTPPVLAGDDMMILAPHFDAIIFVVEEGRTLKADLRESFRILAPTPILGTVLNRTLTPSRAHYYGRYPEYPVS